MKARRRILLAPAGGRIVNRFVAAENGAEVFDWEQLPAALKPRGPRWLVLNGSPGEVG